MGEPELISAGVDWLTVTTASPDRSMQLAMHASGMVHHQRMSGAIDRAWGLSGFSGYQVGDIQLGQRDDECIVRLMSDAAQTSWRRFYELADSVTRLDVQVTVEMGQDCQELVWKYYRQANRMSAKRKRGPKNRVILGNDGGATLYCGERTSNRFGRCYAKGPQTKLKYYETALRFEVQYNGRLAKLVARKLYDSKSERAFCINRSSSFFHDRIGSVPIRIESVIKDTCPRKRTDVERKLEWLRDCVRPSVRLLLELDHADEVYRALGLPKPK